MAWRRRRENWAGSPCTLGSMTSSRAAVELPVGTVTFLFTDVERSTVLAQRLGSRFTELIADHFRLIRVALDARGGVEVKSTGDGVFAVFASAQEGLAAAEAIQLAFTSHRWEVGGDVRVRIGMPTGEAEVVDNDYVGVAVHKASRIMSAGHGGQVLVSSTTRALVDDGDFVDLGSHQLRGLDGEERIYQLTIPGLPADFPPLNTATTTPTNLPVRLSSILGREEEATALVDLLADNRLVTLLGPGGVGKTSLAITVGAQLSPMYPGGVHFADVADVTDPALVVPTIAAVLGAEPKDVEGVVAKLAEAETLVIVDNLEHVIDAATDVARIGAGRHGSKLLVTSQVPLRVSGERRFVLGPLDTGDADSPGVALFLDRARAADPSFTADPAVLAQLVDYLDGLPLAIELVAARANLLSVDQMLERLESGRLTAAAPVDAAVRHRSLEDALRWSYDLLDPQTQQMLRRLGVFAGGIGIDAVEAVAVDAPDPLALFGELVDRSLVVRSPESSSRFSMLDAIRRFARARLDESDEVRAIEERYVKYFLDLGRQAFEGLQGDRQEWWRAQFDAEVGNVREVLAMLLRTGRIEDGLELLGNVWRWHHSRGYFVELELWLDRFFAPTAAEESLGVVKGLMARGALLYWREQAADGVAYYERALEIARRLGDERLLAEALHGLGGTMIVAGDGDGGWPHLMEAKEIYEALGDKAGLADILAGEAFRTIISDGPVGASALVQRASDLYEEVGRHIQATHSLYGVSLVAMAEGRLDDALDIARTGLRRGREFHDVSLYVWGIESVASILVEMGDFETAALLVGAGEAGRTRIGGGWAPSSVGLDDAKTALEKRLGEDEAERLIAPGREMGLEEALQLALGEAG